MTSRKEPENEKDGILERVLQSLRWIGQNVERIVYRVDLYATGKSHRYDDEWSPDELYDNGEY